MSLIKATAKADFTNTHEFFLNVKSKIASAVIRSQEILLQEAVALVPVDTGELQASIRTVPPTDDGEMVTGQVEATADHAGYVEFGTGVRGSASAGADHRHTYDPTWPGMPAQPFLRPALDVARARILQEFSR